MLFFHPTLKFAFYGAHLELEDIILPRVGYLTCAPTLPTFRRWQRLCHLQPPGQITYSFYYDVIIKKGIFSV